MLPVFLAAMLFAQSENGTLRGTLTDNSGAVIPGAAVTLTSGAATRAATTRLDGGFSFVGLAEGDYTLRVAYPGFGLYEKTVTLGAGKTVDLPVRLTVTAEKQQVTVKGDPGTGVSVESDNNAAALVMKGQDLDALPDDAGDLNDMLQALAGPGAGPNGGQLYVDGFSGGKLPAKNTIREIRINQNPFSAEYDRIGMGRIEILTKPGTDKFHGNFGLFDSDAYFNSRNPYADNKADYSNRFFFASVSGAISKRATFYFNGEIERLNTDALIHAVSLDPVTLADSPVRATVLMPSHQLDLEPRLDYQLSTNHTLTVRWDYSQGSHDNNGIGQYSLLSRAYDSDNAAHEIRVTETAILSPKAVNDTRVAVDYNRSNQYGTTALPSIVVTEAFSAGGDQVGRAYDTNRRFELQNNTSIGHGRHTFRFGLRARRSSESQYSPSNFGGTYTFFGVGAAPVLDANNQPVAGQTADIGSLEQYRRTLLFQKLGYSAAQIRSLGGGASQFSIAGGNPLAEVAQTDLGIYAQDDWRLRPNLTLSYGLRYEVQTNIGDHHDFAPRIGLAWAPRAQQGKPQKTVIRIGGGFFYDRVGANLTLQQLRYNGVNQQQFLIMNPDFFPAIPVVSSLAAAAQPLNTYRMDANLRAPMMSQGAVTLERQLPGKTTVSTTYLAMHTTHTLRTVNINAPLPGSGLLPYGNAGNLFLYESDGTMNQNMLVATVNNRLSAKFSFGANYQFMSAHTDADNLAFPSNTYDFKQDYARPTFMRRHRAFFFGSFLLPYGFRFNPNVVTASGVPYNLIVGRDLNGDTISNDRPAFATDLKRASVVVTRFGAFDTNPLPGAKIVPRNYLTGDPMWNFNMRIGRDFKFGRVKSESSPSPGSASKPEQRFTANFSFFVNNVFNHLNRGGWVGNLASPLFGQSTSINLFRETSNNRRIQFGTTLNF
jgi:hypothetical protein